MAVSEQVKILCVKLGISVSELAYMVQVLKHLTKN